MPSPEADAGEPIPVIVNRNGGTAASLGDRLVEEVVAAFAAAGRVAEVQAIDGGDIADSVRALADAPLVVVGGGDGTLGSAAHARVESGGGTLGLLPLGTRNHLALELGIPPTLAEAAAVIAAGATRRIDLGTVNGLGFVNNASIGFYPSLVKSREAEQELHGLPKWAATLPAAWATLRRLPHHRLRLRLNGRDRPLVTPLLFVGNNRYLLERGHVGERLALDDGTLSVFAVSAQSRAGLIWFALRTLVGFSNPARDFAAVGECSDFTVDAHAGKIDIAVDGEVHRLATPLHFEVQPLALTVIVPKNAVGAGTAA